MAGSEDSFTPKFQLFTSDGLTLLFTFPAVNFTNAPQSVSDSIEISNLRSSNAIIIDGGNDKPWDLQMNFNLRGNNYIDVTNKIEELEATVLSKVAYILRIERSDVALDSFEFRVKRLVPFTYDEGLRRKIQGVTAIFRASSW